MGIVREPTSPPRHHGWQQPGLRHDRVRSLGRLGSSHWPRHTQLPSHVGVVSRVAVVGDALFNEIFLERGGYNER